MRYWLCVEDYKKGGEKHSEQIEIAKLPNNNSNNK